jgi:SLT domain-containing protein
MKGKITLLVGGAVGYVLGTRAGRERYEQIKSQAQSVWKSPKVQEKATQAQDFAREKAPVVKDKAAEAAAAAKEKVSSSDTTTSSAPYPTSASTGTV